MHHENFVVVRIWWSWWHIHVGVMVQQRAEPSNELSIIPLVTIAIVIVKLVIPNKDRHSALDTAFITIQATHDNLLWIVFSWVLMQCISMDSSFHLLSFFGVMNVVDVVKGGTSAFF